MNLRRFDCFHRFGHFKANVTSFRRGAMYKDTGYSNFKTKVFGFFSLVIDILWPKISCLKVSADLMAQCRNLKHAIEMIQ